MEAPMPADPVEARARALKMEKDARGLPIDIADVAAALRAEREMALEEAARVAFEESRFLGLLHDQANELAARVRALKGQSSGGME